MPRFPYCDDSTATEYQALKACFDRAFLNCVYQNLDFPKFDLNEIRTDRIVVSFIVLPSGKIDSIQVIKSIHPIADAALDSKQMQTTNRSC